MDAPHNWTLAAPLHLKDEPWPAANATDVIGDHGSAGSSEDDKVLVGYGHDPWGPSQPMDAESHRGRGLGSSSSQRPRRNVVHLYNMVLCATGCNPVIYKGYGCYCGFLGSGAPIDGIDRCCKMHDWCYNTANCPMFFEYFVPYYWKCYHHRPLCAIDHGIYGGPGSCAQRLCECDRLLSECLSHYRCPKRRAVCHSSPVRFLIQSLIMF
ncbi:basic phospholipase A2 KBf-VA [Ischnura elegans]|uniref:basic phospholipase A2 KBf-VA n=1 Tax=Ischnura elegans TaxID=197161 RepID=UPI001ED8A106|nr:basic phospholipase A2 KBf-VA [Ischnura elegans]